LTRQSLGAERNDQSHDKGVTGMSLMESVAPSNLPVTVEPAAQPTDAVVAVVGLGYVGLPTALACHAAGMSVIGVDVSRERVGEVLGGSPELLPADMRRLELARSDTDRFVIGMDAAALSHAACVLICVPTPIDERQTPNLAPLAKACEAVVAQAHAGQLLVLTSTTYVGCTRDLLVNPLAARGLMAGQQVHVCFAPERIDPANTSFALTDVPKVVGGVTEACSMAAVPFLGALAKRLHLVSSPEAAEMTKLLENTYRAVNITLANEFADVARTMSLNPIEVIEAAATKPYGFMPFYPGPGVGGHCIPCDPHYLLWQLREARLYPPVISAAMQGIATRPARIVQRAAEVLEMAGRPLRGARVLVVGVSYKPNIADTRESPAIEVIRGLRDRGARVSIYDPVAGSVRLDQQVLHSVPCQPKRDEHDLVVVTCRHHGVGEAAIAEADLVLDATYSLPEAGNRFVP
jgi:UDP-N-acetyl-D-glucosamine dehydrogenase